MQRNALIVKDTKNSKRPDLAFFPADAFDLFDPELSFEQKQYFAKQITASIIAHLSTRDNHFHDDYLPINILSFIKLHDGSFSILIQDRFRTYEILGTRGQNGKPTGLYLAQTESLAQTLTTEVVEFRYDFDYGKNTQIYENYFRSLKDAKQKQLTDFLNGGLRITPPETVSPTLLLPAEPKEKAAKKSATYFGIDGTRDEAINRLSTLNSTEEQIKANLEKERAKVTAITDARLKHFATAQFETLERATAATLEKLTRTKTELQGTLEVIDTQLLAAWNARIIAAVQVEHAKKLLVCAIYNAAIEYFIDIQKETEGRKDKINELNACFAGIIKFGEDGTFTSVEDAYNNLLTRFNEIRLKEFCENIIARCNTSRVFGFAFRASTKIELIASNIKRYAMKHELSEFEPVFRLDGLKISFNFNQETTAKKLDEDERSIRAMLDDLSKVLVSQLVDIESELQTSGEKFATFQSALETRNSILDTCRKLAILQNNGIKKAQEIRANIASILLLQSDPTVSEAIQRLLIEADFDNAQRNFDADILSIATNTDISSLIISDDDGGRDVKLQAILNPRLYHAKHAMIRVVAFEKKMIELLASCEKTKRSILDQQAIEAQRAHAQLLATAAALEESNSDDQDLHGSNNSSRNLGEDLLVARAQEPKLEAVAKESVRREPEKPGFFKRHLAKLIGGSTGAVIGAGIGAGIGFFLLPVTFGLSVPLLAAIGGVVGGAAVGVGVGTGIGAIVDSTPPEPKKPGFFKRHFSKLVGGASGAVIGAAIGAGIGFALLPLTFGLSVPLFAAIGGVIGGAIVGVTVGTTVGAAMDKSSAKKRIASAASRDVREAENFRSTHRRVNDVVPPGPESGNSHVASASASSVVRNDLSPEQLALYRAAEEAETFTNSLRFSQN